MPNAAWDITFAEAGIWQGEHAFSQWPRPNTKRIIPNYRWPTSEPDGLPRPSHYSVFVRAHDVPPGEFWRAWLLEPTNVAGLQTAVCTPDEMGRVLTFRHKEYLPPGDPIPDFGGQYGLEWLFEFVRPDFAMWRVRYRWPYVNAGDGHNPKLNMNGQSWTNDLVEVIGGDPRDDDLRPDLLCSIDPYSECTELLGGPVTGPLPGMAEFNGVDSYIALDHDLVNVNDDFVISARIRLKNIGTDTPFFGRENAGGFLGMDGADLVFGNFRKTTSWVPVQDVWFDWRFEFEQQTQLGYKLFIDDVEVDSWTGNRQQIAFNRIGVYRHSHPQVIWGHFDMQNLSWKTGPAPSTLVQLNMPLDTNALDLGPDANHGTTFNMVLPSV